MAASAQDAIIMMDSNGNISFWNEAAQQIFGYTRKESIGKALHDLLVPERYYEAYQKGLGIFRGTGTGSAIGKTLELWALRKDGTEFPVELSLSSVQLEGEWVSVGIVRDISERRQAEEDRKNLIADLQDALAKVKTLSGMLPICSSCKKIRGSIKYSV
jgi:PAS domain S-box-containing protein